MEKKGVIVAVRTRPSGSFAQNEIAIDPESNTIKLNNLGKSSNAVLQNRKSNYSFKYDRVMHNASQETMFHLMVEDIVRSVLEGHNGTVFAYGQTGAGKTFTMIGPTTNFKQRGISPRSISMIFQEVEKRTDTDFKIEASYLEIYNERIFDLLDDISNENQKGEFQIVDDPALGTHVKGMTKEVVETEEECLNLLFQGEIGRTTATHRLNKRSNRSHCIFTLYIEQRSKLGGSENIRRSKLHLVDLAGSERQKKTLGDSISTSDAATRRESQYINKSLTFLEQVIVALTSKSRSHIPYRQTKLTNFLKDSLGGNCRTLMVACIWAEQRHLDETISTLQLAQRMMKVKNRSKVNLHQDPEMLVRKYERIIKELKQELTMHDALTERTGVVYEEFTPEQQQEISQCVRRYLATPEGEDEDVIEIKSVKQIKETFRQFKLIVAGMEAEVRHNLQSGASGAGPLGAGTGANADGDAPASSDRGVGKLEKSGGFGLGAAPTHARPASVDSLHVTNNRSKGKALNESLDSLSSSPRNRPRSPNKIVSSGNFATSLDKNEQYDIFKKEDGKELNDKLVELNAKKREISNSIRAATSAINKTKGKITELSNLLKEKKMGRQSTSEEDVIDEEEFVLLKQERDAKRTYRGQMTELKELKKTLTVAKKQGLRQKAALLDAFNVWFKEQLKYAPQPEEDEEEMESPDVLDYGEQFDEMERTRVMEEDPDSLAFFKARKNMGNTLRSTRNARVHKLAKKRQKR